MIENLELLDDFEQIFMTDILFVLTIIVVCI